jgi:tetratricopeptide (TPR) repeat protein
MLASYRDAIEANPDDVSLYVFRSFLNWSEHGRELATMRDCDRILELDPDNRYAYLFCGTLKFFTGDLAEAEADLARVVELEPDNAEIHGVIGVTYIEIGQFERGLEYIRRAFELGADAPVLYVMRADAYAGLGDRQTAAGDYLRHIEAIATETVEGEELIPDEPVTVEMAAGRVFRLPITAQAGQVLSIRTRARPEVVDTLIVILDESGEPLAGNDDSPSLNAALNRVEAPVDGTYTLLVTSFNGVGEGEVEIELEVSDGV